MLWEHLWTVLQAAIVGFQQGEIRKERALADAPLPSIKYGVPILPSNTRTYKPMGIGDRNPYSRNFTGVSVTPRPPSIPTTTSPSTKWVEDKKGLLKKNKTSTTTTTYGQSTTTIAPNTGSAGLCPKAEKYGSGPPNECEGPSDPNGLPRSKLEDWFTKDIFEDLFPFSNLGWGPTPCFPYSYESFIIAARYFPDFGTSSPNENYTADQNHKRDLATFFAHAIQETGENNINLYNDKTRTNEQSDDCFYRGGFYNWFEGGPSSGFLPPEHPGYQPEDGNVCSPQGRYCAESPELNYWYPCSNTTTNSTVTPYTGCYFGRGAIQISYNYNYGQFSDWLKTKNITYNLLEEPNLVMTSMNPPLAIMASLWFYMTPQPPKPAMHDIIMGTWNSGPVNEAQGYSGPILGPTSLIINNECGGEDPTDPGGPGESRRIKAFKWFCSYFGVPAGSAKELTCKDMPVPLDQIKYNYSYQPDWANTWKEQPCDCAPAAYAGIVPYFDPNFYPEQFVESNDVNRLRCIASIYANPSMYSMDNSSSPCLNF
ncbi:hypothetical protein WR25_24124 [Diploscapter pachys]|uniref:Glycoside hydrolase family 19 catalytic domain-containing protein n=1 Tax=Diploscapter pachys TaxID=2018661 RepID=A0A2A2K1S7_9BILA|nr:hypothetical protein WR25_24124 [Diploscapter pachys]